MKMVYPKFVWNIPTKENTIFLTFDDGPIPDVTEFVLENLEKYNAKATFFCIGDNIRKHPKIFKKLIEDGHSIGNHTFNHLNGWKHENKVYLENAENCNKIIKLNCPAFDKVDKKPLFRPPYGRIKRNQAQLLLADYQIVMWDVLSGDFSLNLSPETILNKTLKYTEKGSIVLFHDSIKANKNMSYALPRFLEHFSERGFQFLAL